MYSVLETQRGAQVAAGVIARPLLTYHTYYFLSNIYLCVATLFLFLSLVRESIELCMIVV
jgi:hypothetical protein